MNLRRAMMGALTDKEAAYDAWVLGYTTVAGSAHPYLGIENLGYYKYLVTQYSGVVNAWGKPGKHTGDTAVRFMVGMSFESIEQYAEHVGRYVLVKYSGGTTSSSFVSRSANGIITKGYGQLSAKNSLIAMTIFSPDDPASDPITGALELLNPGP